jgi:hypothetical protein
MKSFKYINISKYVFILKIHNYVHIYIVCGESIYVWYAFHKKDTKSEFRRIKMEEIITTYMDSLKLGEPQVHKNMAVIPLIGPDSKLDYIVFDEALKKGLTVKETGTVQKLNFFNDTGKEILIIQGEYVVGGAQNRMLAQNIYMAKNFKGDVPVNCVQHGRWTTHIPKGFTTQNRRATPKVYAAAFRGQGEVWDSVNMLSSSLKCFSDTQDYNEVYERKGNDVNEYAEMFSYVPGALGIVTVIQNNGRPSYVVDVFDQSSTLKKNFKKLIESSALEAAISGKEITDMNPQEFIQKINNARSQERTAISLGKDYRLDSSEIEGSALIVHGLPLYVNYMLKDGDSKNSSSNPGTGFIRRPGIPPLIIRDDPFPGHRHRGRGGGCF